MPGRASLAAGLAGLGLLAATLVGCGGGSGSAKVPPPALDSEQATQACNALAAALPAVLDGHQSRTTEPDSPLTAAWADPAIVLRCGVGTPAALQPTSQLYTINEVDWLAEETEDGWRFTTVGRIVNVELAVPGRYEPAVNPLVDLSAPIIAAIPEPEQPGD